MKSSLVIAFCTLMQLSPQYDCMTVFDILQPTKQTEYSKEVIPRDSPVQTSSEELEFLKDNRIDMNSGSTEETDESDRKQKSKAKPPLYMKLVYDKISEATNYPYQPFSVPYKGLLLRAWLPLGITRESSSDFTLINFQQTTDRSKLGRFLQAQIILTLRSDIEVSTTDSTRTLLNLHLENQNVTTELIDPGTRAFYSFNITDYLNEKLVETVTHPVPVSFKFTVSSSGQGNAFLDELFDVQVDQPFIMFYYEKFPKSFFPRLKKPQRMHRRRSRSLASTVTTTQQTKTTTTGQRVNIDVLDLLPVNNATNTTLPDNLISPTVPATNISENVMENFTTNTAEAQTQLPHTTRNNEHTILPTSASTIPNPPPLVVGNKTIPTIASILPTTIDCCKRYEHFIIPEQVDWYDVIEPRRIDIGYCSGQCAYPIEYGASEDYKVHTLLIDRYRQRQEVPSNYPRSASCVPVKYLPKSIFQFEDDDAGMVVKYYQDVTVHTCGCR